MDTVREAIEEIRSHLGEQSAKHWKEERIVGALNRAQVAIVRKMQMSSGAWLTKKSAALTPSSNRFTLPSDCGKAICLEQVSNGSLIFLENYSVTEKNQYQYTTSGLTTSGLTAFMIEGYVEVNAESFTETCYLWYDRNLSELTLGSSLELPDAAWDVLIMKALWLLMLKPATTLAKEFYYFVRDEKKQAEKEFDSWVSTRTKSSSRVRGTGAYQHG